MLSSTFVQYLIPYYTATSVFQWVCNSHCHCCYNTIQLLLQTGYSMLLLYMYVFLFCYLLVQLQLLLLIWIPFKYLFRVFVFSYIFSFLFFVVSHCLYCNFFFGIFVSFSFLFLLFFVNLCQLKFKHFSLLAPVFSSVNVGRGYQIVDAVWWYLFGHLLENKRK